MKTLLIYDEFVLLSRDQHRALMLAPAPAPARFAFARGTNSVPIAASELPLAALDFPGVFVSNLSLTWHGSHDPCHPTHDVKRRCFPHAGRWSQ